MCPGAVRTMRPLFNTCFFPLTSCAGKQINGLEFNEEERHVTTRTPVIAGGSHFVWTYGEEVQRIRTLVILSIVLSPVPAVQFQSCPSQVRPLAQPPAVSQRFHTEWGTSSLPTSFPVTAKGGAHACVCIAVYEVRVLWFRGGDIWAVLHLFFFLIDIEW